MVDQKLSGETSPDLRANIGRVSAQRDHQDKPNDVAFSPEDQSSWSDSDLISAFVNRRCSDAFRQIVFRYGPLVLSVCRQNAGGHDVVEDAFQETFVVLVNRIDRIRSPELLASWLYGVANRVSKDVVRRSQRHLRRTISLSSEIMSQHPQSILPQVPPEESIELALRTAVDQLPDNYRAPIVLCYFMGETHVAAAKKLDVPEGSISKKLKIGQEKIKRTLKRLGFVVPLAAIVWLLHQMRIEVTVPKGLLASTLAKTAGVAATGSGLTSFFLTAVWLWPKQSKLLGLLVSALVVVSMLASVELLVLRGRSSLETEVETPPQNNNSINLMAAQESPQVLVPKPGLSQTTARSDSASATGCQSRSN